MENPVLIFGANYIGRAAKEIFEGNGNVVYGFLDDNKELHGKEVDGVMVLGSIDDDGFLKLVGKKCDAFVAVDDNRLRKSIVKTLNEERKAQPVNAIHSSANISSNASVGHGNFIDAGVKIAVGAKLGNFCILQTGAIISVESVVGDFVQLGAGSVINSGSIVENEVFIGSGVTIVSGITIGKGARVGAGSVVIGPVKAGETVFGNPAQPIKS